MKLIRKSEDKIRTLLSSLLLIGIFSIAIYFVLTTPEEIPIEASKLVIVKPSEIPVRNEVVLTIKAINDDGFLDIKRDDLVEIALDPNSHAQIGYLENSNIIWSNSLLIRLEAGLAKVKFVDPKFERIRISVEWIEGNSKLESNEVQLFVGYRVSQIIGLP
jgi:hypothetical protein